MKIVFQTAAIITKKVKTTVVRIATANNEHLSRKHFQWNTVDANKTKKTKHTHTHTHTHTEFDLNSAF